MDDHIKLGQINFQLKGWKAAAFVGALILFMGFRTLGPRAISDPSLNEALRLEIEGERIRKTLPGLTEAMEDKDYDEVDELKDEVLSKIQILETVSSKVPIPFFRDDEQVIQVTYFWSDSPSKKITRYYRVETSGFTGWFVEYETNSVSYYLDFF